MKRASIFAVTGAALLALAFAFAATPKPVHWSMTATLRKGGSVSAHLHATIQPGWHLYAMDQKPGGPVATRIRVAPHQGFTLSGNIGESTPRTTLDPNFNLQTRYYEGQASFTIPLQAASHARAAGSKVTIDVLYQTCNDHLCLPPQTAHVTAAVRP